MSTTRTPLASLGTSVNISGEVSSTDKPTNSAKRQHSAIEDDDADDDDDENDDPQLRYVTDSCDQVRRKINNFINSGEMKVGEFQKAIGVNSKAYGNFMTQHGPSKGIHSSVYYKAFKFFKKREIKGIPMPKKKVKKAEEDKKLDVSGIHLHGEETGEVEVYDTCDEVRRKIAAFLREPGVTQAGLLREVSKMLSKPKKIQSKQLQDFLGKKGALAGNTSSVYYGSYVLFEKMRLKAGKKKSKTRLETEEEWAEQGGIDRKRANRAYWCLGDERPVEDKYGKVSFV